MEQLNKYQKIKAKKWKEAMTTFKNNMPCVLACKRWTLTQAYNDFQTVSIRDPEYVKKRLSLLEIEN